MDKTGAIEIEGFSNVGFGSPLGCWSDSSKNETAYHQVPTSETPRGSAAVDREAVASCEALSRDRVFALLANPASMRLPRQSSDLEVRETSHPLGSLLAQSNFRYFTAESRNSVHPRHCSTS